MNLPLDKPSPVNPHISMAVLKTKKERDGVRRHQVAFNTTKEMTLFYNQIPPMPPPREDCLH